MTGGPEEPLLRETILAPGARVFCLGGDTPATSFGANCLAVAGERETLVVDPFIAPAHARMVEAAVARAGLPPVAVVVLTHHHTDHALGAGHFSRKGARVVAHARCARAMAEQHPAILAERRRDPELAALFVDAAPHAPNAVVNGALTIDLGGVGVEVMHLGHGHTAGDCVVLVPSLALAAAGDLVFRGYHYNYEEADPRGVRAGLAALAGRAHRFVPGHGDTGGPEILDEQRRYHDEAERVALASAGEESCAEALRARFPAHRLPAAAVTAFGFWRAARG